MPQKDSLVPIYQIMLGDMEKDVNGIIFATCAPKNRELVARICRYLSECPPKDTKSIEIIISKLVEMRTKIQPFRNDDALQTIDELSEAISALSNLTKERSK
ncbi:hypothetical protein A2811_00820 [Candidatus Campbellbacteria bacterium RIFCSPHIGHO2_01_FULL_34_10]|uniref:Uncharacterized protein n=1 Tax=Candidatus Campbellbacteria bacterium RIFCSPHIGHO2_01_FULL_34_10 TaxID=1797577 RepID=A0A1F5EQA9_9BACT|nr:MAG: hypothetical protein A2811_00820 [Candidatus Campbellbacteria bacterium RIFCSPHIGHO2_01_FULL_34_10]